jgi:pimeloyl-ACP methyl ester carboxylesterase
MIRRVTRRVLGRAAAMFDRAAVRAAQAHAINADGEFPRDMPHAERVARLRGIIEHYPESLIADYFPERRSIEPLLRTVKRARRGPGVYDLTWPSDYTCRLEGFSERYLRTRENQVAAARLFTREKPRPAAILIHGYMAGRFGAEERLWPIEWLDAIGLDVVLFVLPFHALRKGASHRGMPEFPGRDPRMCNEGFRQAIFDLRNLAGWLKQRGHSDVGLMGMSLGGYTAALAATVDETLCFVVPLIPLASIADFARERGNLSRIPEQQALEHELLERAYRIVSPMSRAPRVDPERVIVVGAQADQITPVSHARRIAGHFSAPLIAWHGGHLLQFGRERAFRRIGELLARLGVAKSAL